MCSAPSLRNLPNVAFKTLPMFVWLTMALSRPFFQGISSISSSFNASLLQAIDGVMSLALCPQIVSQVPQHFRASEKNPLVGVAMPASLSAVIRQEFTAWCVWNANFYVQFSSVWIGNACLKKVWISHGYYNLGGGWEGVGGGGGRCCWLWELYDRPQRATLTIVMS